METDPKTVLQANLAALFKLAKANPRLGWPANTNQLARWITAHRRHGISKSTLDRVIRADSSLQVSHLVDIAAAYGLQPWELLHPQFDPHPAASPAKVFKRALAELARRHAHEEELLAQLGGINGPNPDGIGSPRQAGNDVEG